MDDFDLVRSDEFGAMGSCGPVTLNIALRAPDLAHIDAVEKNEARVVAAHGWAGSFTIIALSAVAPMSKSEREATHRMMLGSPVKAAAMVVEGAGFRAATARTVIAGFYLLKRPYEYKVTSTLDEGAAWLVAALARQGREPPTAVALARAMARLRATLS